jgi:hypothetical protein
MSYFAIFPAVKVKAYWEIIFLGDLLKFDVHVYVTLSHIDLT